jgi:hypothetical protein
MGHRPLLILTAQTLIQSHGLQLVHDPRARLHHAVPVPQAWSSAGSPVLLQIRATSQVQTYGPGSQINGIEWLPGYSDFYLFMTNLDSIDYDDIDAEVSTDLVITNLRQITRVGRLQNCGHP